MENKENEIYNSIKIYLGEKIHSKSLDSSTKEALSRMSLLKKNEFSDLLGDVYDEILRRKNNVKTEIEHKDNMSNRRNLSRKRLSKIEESKFCSLLYDIYIVYSYRYPSSSFKKTSEIESLIDDLSQIVKSIREDVEYEKLIIKKIKSEVDIKEKLFIFSGYVRRIFECHNQDLAVINFMDSVFEDVYNQKTVHMTKYLHPLNLIASADKFFESNETQRDEYEYHRENIVGLLKEDMYSDEVKKQLIGKEMASIFMLLYKVSCRVNEDVVEKSIEPEVETIIGYLNDLKIEMQGTINHFTFSRIAENVINVTDSIKNKLMNSEMEDSTLIADLCESQAEIKEALLQNDIDKISAAIFHVANSIKSILYDISNNVKRK